MLIGFVWILLSYMLFGFLVFFLHAFMLLILLSWCDLICFAWLWYVFDDENLEVVIKILVMLLILFGNDENLAPVLLMLILFGSNFNVWWGHLIHRMFLLSYLRFQRIVTQKILAMIQKSFVHFFILYLAF